MFGNCVSYNRVISWPAKNIHNYIILKGPSLLKRTGTLDHCSLVMLVLLHYQRLSPFGNIP